MFWNSCSNYNCQHQCQIIIRPWTAFFWYCVNINWELCNILFSTCELWFHTGTTKYLEKICPWSWLSIGRSLAWSQDGLNIPWCQDSTSLCLVDKATHVAEEGKLCCCKRMYALWGWITTPNSRHICGKKLTSQSIWFQSWFEVQKAVTTVECFSLSL